MAIIVGVERGFITREGENILYWLGYGRSARKDFLHSPTAALSSFPYTPEQSMDFLKYLYFEADSLVGEYGPYDAFSHENNWYLPRYLSIDQGPIPVMIENYRTSLIWDLFMSGLCKNRMVGLFFQPIKFF